MGEEPIGLTEFAGSLNLLIVEDEPTILSLIAETVSSPLVAVHEARTVAEADRVIGEFGGKWHGWIVDIGLSSAGSGLDLVEKHPLFPFAIVYSGMQSLSKGAEALRKGAAAVVDKGEGSVGLLARELCNLLPLAAVCDGELRAQRSVFFLLRQFELRTPNAWAEKACISLRQLENITSQLAGMPPSWAIGLYYGLRHVLRNDICAVAPSAGSPEEEEFIAGCWRTIDRNRSFFRKRLAPPDDYR